MALHPPRRRFSSPALWRQATGQDLFGGTLGGLTKISQQLFLMHGSGMTLSNGLAFLRPIQHRTAYVHTDLHYLHPGPMPSTVASTPRPPWLGLYSRSKHFRQRGTRACTCKRHDHSVESETLGLISKSAGCGERRIEQSRPVSYGKPSAQRLCARVPRPARR